MLFNIWNTWEWSEFYIINFSVQNVILSTMQELEMIIVKHGIKFALRLPRILTQPLNRWFNNTNKESGDKQFEEHKAGVAPYHKITKKSALSKMYKALRLVLVNASFLINNSGQNISENCPWTWLHLIFHLSHCREKALIFICFGQKVAQRRRPWSQIGRLCCTAPAPTHLGQSIQTLDVRPDYKANRMLCFPRRTSPAGIALGRGNCWDRTPPSNRDNLHYSSQAKLSRLE